MATDRDGLDVDEQRELRAIERAEEAAYDAAYVGADAKPDIGQAVRGVSSSLVRDWVRSALVPDAVKRLFDVGMGVTRFDVPTMAGNTVSVPAPASVQVRALQAVVSIGVPQQLGLTDESDPVPGVLALGEWELAAAREEAHPEGRRITGGVEVPNEPAEQSPESPVPPETIGERITAFARGIADEIAHEITGGYTPPEGHTVVVVDENATAAQDTRGEEPPPPVAVDRNKLAREILAKRRRARQTLRGPGAGPMPGGETPHPNLT